jgi:hypothetical protein
MKPPRALGNYPVNSPFTSPVMSRPSGRDLTRRAEGADVEAIQVHPAWLRHGPAPVDVVAFPLSEGTIDHAAIVVEHVFEFASVGGRCRPDAYASSDCRSSPDRSIRAGWSAGESSLGNSTSDVQPLAMGWCPIAKRHAVEP